MSRERLEEDILKVSEFGPYTDKPVDIGPSMSQPGLRISTDVENSSTTLSEYADKNSIKKINGQLLFTNATQVWRPVTKNNIMEFLDTQQSKQKKKVVMTQQQKIFHYISATANVLMMLNVNLVNILTADITFFQNFLNTGGVKIFGTLAGLAVEYIMEDRVYLYKFALVVSAIIKIVCIFQDDRTGPANYVIQMASYFQVAVRAMQMFRLMKYNNLMTLVFISINVVTEYKQESNFSLRIVMVVFESIYMLLELVCVFLAYFMQNPTGVITTIQPDFAMEFFSFAELAAVIIDLGILSNFLVPQLSSVGSLVGIEIGQMVAGMLGALVYWSFQHYQKSKGTDKTVGYWVFADTAFSIVCSAFMFFFAVFQGSALGFIAQILQFVNIAFIIAKLVRYMQQCVVESHYLSAFCICAVFPIAEFVSRVVSHYLGNFEVIVTAIVALEAVALFSHVQYDSSSDHYRQQLVKKFQTLPVDQLIDEDGVLKGGALVLDEDSESQEKEFIF